MRGAAGGEDEESRGGGAETSTGAKLSSPGLVDDSGLISVCSPYHQNS